jgi:hypothetical protein
MNTTRSDCCFFLRLEREEAGGIMVNHPGCQFITLLSGN